MKNALGMTPEEYCVWMRNMTDEEFDKWENELIALEPKNGVFVDPVFSSLPARLRPIYEKETSEGNMSAERGEYWLNLANRVRRGGKHD